MHLEHFKFIFGLQLFVFKKFCFIHVYDVTIKIFYKVITQFPWNVIFQPPSKTVIANSLKFSGFVLTGRNCDMNEKILPKSNETIGQLKKKTKNT